MYVKLVAIAIQHSFFSFLFFFSRGAFSGVIMLYLQSFFFFFFFEHVAWLPRVMPVVLRVLWPDLFYSIDLGGSFLTMINNHNKSTKNRESICHLLSIQTNKHIAQSSNPSRLGMHDVLPVPDPGSPSHRLRMQLRGS